jgi:hypothetical protein
VIVEPELTGSQLHEITAQYRIGIAIAANHARLPFRLTSGGVGEGVRPAIIVPVVGQPTVIDPLRVLLSADSQAARHLHDVSDADRGAGIARSLPFRDRGRLVQRVDAALHQRTQQRSHDALAL